MNRSTTAIQRPPTIVPCDEAAFATAYARYRPRVYAAVARIVRDRSRSEDAAQTVFLKLWEAPHVLTSAYLPAWLARVAHNQAISTVRAMRNDALEAESLQRTDDIADAVCARVDAQPLFAACSRLPAPQLEALRLGFFEDLTHRQIAARTHLPLGTVKTRIRAGLFALRSTLLAARRDDQCAEAVPSATT